LRKFVQVELFHRLAQRIGHADVLLFDLDLSFGKLPTEEIRHDQSEGGKTMQGLTVALFGILAFSIKVLLEYERGVIFRQDDWRALALREEYVGMQDHRIDYAGTNGDWKSLEYSGENELGIGL